MPYLILAAIIAAGLGTTSLFSFLKRNEVKDEKLEDAKAATESGSGQNPAILIADSLRNAFEGLGTDEAEIMRLAWLSKFSGGTKAVLDAYRVITKGRSVLDDAKADLSATDYKIFTALFGGELFDSQAGKSITLYDYWGDGKKKVASLSAKSITPYDYHYSENKFSANEGWIWFEQFKYGPSLKGWANINELQIAVPK